MTFKNFAIAAAAMCAISCAEYDNDFKDSDAYKNYLFGETLNEYTSNFEARYGKIDPNQDWGMMMPGSKDGFMTRSDVPNRNEWIDIYHLEVPGWPDTYYKENDNTLYTNGYHFLDSGGANAQYSSNPASGVLPAGDVTDEEIQYVSWWFRTHKYPSSEKLYWTDFYVQSVSSDNDRDANGDKIAILEQYIKTDGTWGKGQDDVNTTYTIDYFSAEVLQKDIATSDEGWDHIKNFNHDNANKLDVENNLYVGNYDVNQVYNLTAEYKNNYTSAVLTNRLISLYQSSGTENFRAHYSQNSADLDWNIEYTQAGEPIPNSGHSSWVLVHLTFTGKSGRLYDGYYLGFDYQIYQELGGSLAGGDLVKYKLHKADGYYSNWIFKLSPALPISTDDKHTGLSRRIMCEDLGNTYDFDFNDVVFDATYNISQSDYEAYLSGYKNDTPIDVTITLQAAGGTLPIYVGVDPNNRAVSMEAHQLLGNNSSKTPVNVNAPGGATSAVAIYHYKLPFTPSEQTEEARKQALSLNNIPIYVQSSSNIGTYLTTSDTYWGNEYTATSHYTPNNKGASSAPRAFGVPLDVCWMNENQFIETSYTHFPDWVQNQSAWGDNATEPWYMKDVQNTGNIYKYVPYTKPTTSSSSSTDNLNSISILAEWSNANNTSEINYAINLYTPQTDFINALNKGLSNLKIEFEEILEATTLDVYYEVTDTNPWQQQSLGTIELSSGDTEFTYKITNIDVIKQYGIVFKAKDNKILGLKKISIY